jgi:sugar lactone lactonase YvrE
MVVDDEGFAYVGNFGYDIQSSSEFTKTPLIRIDPMGNARYCSPPLAFPNGIVISSDKKSLIVAESVASRLVKFTLSDKGELSDRQKLANIENGFPDGICLDSEGCVWVAAIGNAEVLRINMQGEVINRVATSVNGETYQPIACMLSPMNKRTKTATLFITAAPNDPPSQVSPGEDPPLCYRRRRQGGIFRLDMPAGAAGFP